MGMSEIRKHEAPRVKLEPNISKILEAIAYVIAEAGRRCHLVSQYDVLKTLFLADKSHLNKFGRPVTFDNYFAMRAGPVPSVAYDLLKEDQPTIKKYGIRNLPWARSARPEVGSGRYYYSNAKDVIDEDVLSPSDVAALCDAFATVRGMTVAQLRVLTHSDPAYIEAWKGDDDERQAHQMSLGMLFDSPDFETAERVQFLSKMK
jgi:uncharacterized phage-associated protein